MLTFSQMAVRLLVAMVLGAIIGTERELIGKEAGIRTSMLVCAGSAIFSMAAISLPYIIAQSPANLTAILAGNSGFLTMIANIVVGIGFLGAGLIIKTEGHIHGITTAAIVWIVAAIGILVGLGIMEFAVFAALIIPGLLFALRKMSVIERVKPEGPQSLL